MAPVPNVLFVLHIVPILPPIHSASCTDTIILPHAYAPSSSFEVTTWGHHSVVVKSAYKVDMSTHPVTTTPGELSLSRNCRKAMATVTNLHPLVSAPSLTHHGMNETFNLGYEIELDEEDARHRTNATNRDPCVLSARVHLDELFTALALNAWIPR